MGDRASKADGTHGYHIGRYSLSLNKSGTSPVEAANPEFRHLCNPADKILSFFIGLLASILEIAYNLSVT